ncbi:hypothetical protein L484_001320 [Morus notabilis]|uniref:Protein SAR DEFICIENT 1 n=1 Tax=Morus notabilis TaxID=981085 RepID=W9R3R0_9ROSA|nr:hypothetical protein L484_001320 [Morus notabilis]
MAGKRFFSDSKSDKDLPEEIQKRPRISLASVVGEVVMVNSLQNLFSSLEPLLRRVVKEEVDHGLRRCTRSLTRSSSIRIQALEPSSLQLVFSKKLSLPIFTGSKILDNEGNPLQINLVDKSNGNDQMVHVSLPHPIKIEILVLDGDFPPRDDTWTSDQFDNSIVKERTGKRPLLYGELTVTLRDGFVVVGDIEFTDNSSWIRSRKFRIGARVVPRANSQGLMIREAMTEPFVVKDHRGELYKKHHPPQLEDEVWRLEKIGKDGAFHKKLSSKGVTTVQDFLKLSVIDAQKLRKILGVGMSEKMWEVTLKHAKTCEMGDHMIMDQQYPNNAQQGKMIKGIEQNGHQNLDDKSMMGVGYFLPSNVQMDCTDWMQVNTPYIYGMSTVESTGNRASMSDCSSDCDLAPQGL